MNKSIIDIAYGRNVKTCDVLWLERFPFVHCGFLDATLDVAYELEQTNFKENKFGKGKFFEVFYTGLKYFG